MRLFTLYYLPSEDRFLSTPEVMCVCVARDDDGKEILTWQDRPVERYRPWESIPDYARKCSPVAEI